MEGQCAMKLWGHQETRSPLVNWYLLEVGCKFDEFLPSHADNPHPFKQVPALVDEGGVEIFESGAILMYLSDKYGGLDTPEKRASVAKWIFWANATLDPVLFKVDNAQVVGTNAETNPKPLFQLNGILEGKRYLVNDEFSVADVAVSSYLLYVPQFFPEVKMGIYPNIVNYMARCLERETFVKAFGEQTKQLCVAKCQEYLTAANCTTTS